MSTTMIVAVGAMLACLAPEVFAAPPARVGRPVPVVRPAPVVRPTYPHQPGRLPARPVIVAPRVGDDADAFAAQMFIRHSQRLSCEQVGELLRRISNEMLEASHLRDDEPYRDGPRYPGDRDWITRGEMRKMRQLMKRPQFFGMIMNRLTSAFQSCNRNCFDDGVAIGVISGTGFCNAAVSFGGLPDEGFRYQQRLPVCETGNFVGCQQGYAQAVNSVQGCLGYATGRFTQSYLHYVSQDCHVENYP